MYNILIQSGLILLLALSPLFKGSVPMPALIAAQVFTLGLICLWLAKMNSQGRGEFKRTALDIPILLYLLLAIASLLFSQYLYASLLELNRLLMYFALFYLSANFFGRRNNRQARVILVNVLIAMGGILSLVGIIQYLGGLPHYWIPEKFLASTYVNHNHFAGYLEMLIPLSLALCVFSRGKAKKALYGFLCAFMLLVFILTMSRGGWVSMLILLVFMALMLSRKKSIRIFILLSALSAGIIIFTLDKVGLDPIVRRAIGVTNARVAGEFTSRLSMYKGALAMIKDNPYLGTGIGTLIHTFPRYRPPGLNTLIDYVHNDYLHTAAETGIFALGILLIMAVLFTRRCLYVYRHSRTSLKQGIILAILAGAVGLSLHGLVDFNFHIPANAILFSVLTGLAMGLEVKKDGEKLVRSEKET